MIINSEQEMLDFGANFAKRLVSMGGLAGGTPAARRRKPSTVGETARSGPIKPIVIELLGDVGTGKTTFTRGFAEGLGIKEPITSPSFTISKSYALPNSNGRLIHYDFYRLPEPGLISDDLRENLANPANIIVIEWGESIANILPANHTVIRIKYNNDGSRTLNV